MNNKYCCNGIKQIIVEGYLNVPIVMGTDNQLTTGSPVLYPKGKKRMGLKINFCPICGAALTDAGRQMAAQSAPLGDAVVSLVRRWRGEMDDFESDPPFVFAPVDPAAVCANELEAALARCAEAVA